MERHARFRGDSEPDCSCTELRILGGFEEANPLKTTHWEVSRNFRRVLSLSVRGLVSPGSVGEGEAILV